MAAASSAGRGGNLAKLGIETTFVDGSLTIDASRRRCGRRPSRRFRRELGNRKTWRCLDIRRRRQVRPCARLAFVVRNTVPSPFRVNPIRFGADIVVHSATQYLVGHARRRRRMVESVRLPRDNGNFPALPSPSRYHGSSSRDLRRLPSSRCAPAWKRFGVYGRRARADERLVRWCQAREAAAAHEGTYRTRSPSSAPEFAIPASAWVHYPVLPDHPDHRALSPAYAAIDGAPGRDPAALVRRRLRGGRGVRFIESAQADEPLANIGDTRTLVIHPDQDASPAHVKRSSCGPACPQTWCGSPSGSRHVDDIFVTSGGGGRPVVGRLAMLLSPAVRRGLGLIACCLSSILLSCRSRRPPPRPTRAGRP